jgi:hypothetical protein
MSLAINELRNGISYWRSKNFPPDFHNGYYEHVLVAVQANGAFNQKWWDRFFPILKSWKATRGTADLIITTWAQARFEGLSKAWAVAVAPHLGKDIAEVEWHQIAAFPAIVTEIKGVASPVFTSKFCHFLAPRLFPVTDNELLGLPYPTYEKHFTASRTEWLGTDSDTQNELIRLLTNEIGKPLFSGFPMKCKLIELCMIGRYHGSDSLHCSAT